jgi:hypothetical protein
MDGLLGGVPKSTFPCRCIEISKGESEETDSAGHVEPASPADFVHVSFDRTEMNREAGCRFLSQKLSTIAPRLGDHEWAKAQ